MGKGQTGREGRGIGKMGGGTKREKGTRYYAGTSFPASSPRLHW